MVNLSDPAPEAFMVASIAGAASPAYEPVGSPDWPAMSEGESKPTQRITPGAAHLVAKSAAACPPAPVDDDVDDDVPLAALELDADVAPGPEVGPAALVDIAPPPPVDVGSAPPQATPLNMTAMQVD